MNIFKTIKNAARKVGHGCRVIRDEFVAGYNMTAEVVSVVAKSVSEIPSNVWTCTKETAQAIREHWTVVGETVLFDCNSVDEQAMVLAKEVGIAVKTVITVSAVAALKCFAVAFAAVTLVAMLLGLAVVTAFACAAWAVKEVCTLTAKACGLLTEAISYVIGLPFFTAYAAGEWVFRKVTSSTKQSDPLLVTAA